MKLSSLEEIKMAALTRRVLDMSGKGSYVTIWIVHHSIEEDLTSLLL